MLRSILSNDYYVHFNNTAYQKLNAHLEEKQYSKIFILVDENTHEHCLGYFMSKIEKQYNIEVIEILSGEQNKHIETCSGVWNALSELDADRKSVLLNLGGGVITDLGGFVALTFKRGIDFINIPTTLLSMVDASVGGKTGVDLGPLKNQIGIIDFPQMVLIDPEYLKTLPNTQIRSGYAEMLKHGLITDMAYWNKLSDFKNLTTANLEALIYESVTIKNNVVLVDPREQNLRKTLNYGHTLGHAIETYFLENTEKTTLLHGEAIAIGMVLATYLSVELNAFPKDTLEQVKKTIVDIFGKVSILEEDIPGILSYLKFDKKNSHGNINFVLLEDIGKSVLDAKVPNNLIIKAFDYYKNA